MTALSALSADITHILSRGHDLANSGPMELDVQELLEKIDNLNRQHTHVC